jgi:hypothetical protein
MSNAQWPASLPQSYLLIGQTEQAPNLMLRTQMDAGPAKTRKRFTAGVRMLRVRWLMTRAQKDTFDAFYRETLGGGALRFDYRRQDQDASSGLTGFGSCLEFNGRGTYVRVADHASLSAVSNHLTIEFWLKVNDPNDECGVLHKTAAGGNFEYAVEKPSGNSLLIFRGYALDGSNAYYHTGTIPDADWHHWALSLDGSQSHLFRDGTLLTSEAKLAGNMADGSGALEIGRTPTYGTFGRIDDVRIWQEQRTSEIPGAYNAELVGDETDLAGYWQFNEGTGITAADSQTSGNNDGIIIGANWVPNVEAMRIVSPPQYTVASHEYWHVDTELEVLP